MSKIYKGVFWIKDTNDIKHFAVYLKALCDTNGNFIDISALDLNTLSKTKTNFNHQKVWNTLSKTDTDNKPYNYYPRGRVEIRNGKAIVYANVGIATKKLKDWAISVFHLTEDNGIKEVVLKADGSNHYKSYVEN